MKNFVIFLLCLIIVGFAGSASAEPFYFNADRTGGFDEAIELRVLNGNAGVYSSTVDIGGGLNSDALDNGDNFTENFNLNIYGYTTVDNKQVQFYDTDKHLSAYTSDVAGSTASITGYVDNYADGDGTLITAGNVTKDLLSKDNFAIVFDTSSGYLTLADAGDNIIGTFLIGGGGGDFISNSNGTPTSDVGLSLVAVSLTSGYFYTGTGTDYSELLDTDGTLVIALSDSSINIEAVAAGKDGNSLELEMLDNGTTIRVAVVPEPTTFVLFGVGMLFASGMIRKKQSV